MVWGIWMGLLRIGWALPLPKPDQLIVHVPLMIGGFLGTLVGLERAVGIGRRWAYVSPLLTASASLLLIVGPMAPLAPLLLTAGSVIVVVVFAAVLWRQPSLFAWTMAVGAASWVVGNAMWLGGAAVYRVVFWWMAFLVLTIAGERLELNRFLAPSRFVRVAFASAIVVMGLGVALAARTPSGVRIMGAGLVALSVWLARFDIARRTVRQPGITRFIAVCLLSGYVWLAVGGALALATAAATPGPLYDALLHAIFLGFVVSMIFGHAPIVFPAILGMPMSFRRTFYVHAALLHASVVVRLTGDLVEELGRWRAWGGALNAAAMALFILNSIAALRRSP